MLFWVQYYLQCLFLVVQPDPSCQVSVSAELMFLSSPTRSTSDGIVCGSREQAWLLEAPSGQRINISLLDFSAGSSSSSSSGDVQQRARTVETASSRCVRQFGFIEDKSANRNINICSSSDATAAHRQRTLYVSRSNTVAIVTDSATTGQENQTNRFLIGFLGFSIYAQLSLIKNKTSFYVREYRHVCFNFLSVCYGYSVNRFILDF